MAREDDGAMLSELLALIEGAGAAAWAVELPAATGEISALPRQETPERRRRAMGGAAGLKRSVDAMRREASRLSEELARLRSRHAIGTSQAMELALRERSKRQRAEAECRALRDALYTQTRFVRGLHCVFSATPHFSVSLDLCRFLHRHTRLPRHHRTRWSEFSDGSMDERLRQAMDVLCRETEGLALADQPHDDAQVHGERVDDVDSRSTTAMAVYAVDAPSISAVVRAVCVAIRDVVTICPSGHPLKISRDLVDIEASSSGNVLYRVMDVSHCCPETGEELTMESHVVTSYKILGDDSAVVMWDFVDADELHPTPDATNVTREITGACLIRREWCDRDGVERVVFRSLSTKKFRFRRGVSAEKLGKFECIAHPVSLVRGNELLFRRIVLEQLAAEKASDGRAYAATSNPI